MLLCLFGHAQNAPDVIIAGATDGKVYALNAWTGDMLWMFDSGGSMMDISQCRTRHSQPDTTESGKASYHASERKTSSSIFVKPEDEHASETEKDPESAYPTQLSSSSSHVSSVPTPEGCAPQLIPSLDGRLFHVSKL